MSVLAESLKHSIERAKADVKKLKRVTPYIFLEWQELQSAKEALELAKQRMARAEQAWRDL